MDTASLESYFGEQVAPLHLAESWDNVGLLVDDGRARVHRRVGLTIELTEATLEEALGAEVTFLFVYHPPIFSGLKRLTADDLNSRLVVRALTHGLTLYSSHTALDAAAGGMAEWLAASLGDGMLRPIVLSPRDETESLGAGRLMTLKNPVSLPSAVERIKKHLGIAHLRLAESSIGSSTVRTLAVCPGAGGSLFEKVGDVDLLLTGEMRHHDVLSRVRRGTHVIVTDHTNSERGYLRVLAERIKRDHPSLETVVLSTDRDPLVSL